MIPELPSSANKNTEVHEEQICNLARRSSNGRLVFDPNPPSKLTFIPSEILKNLLSHQNNLQEALCILTTGTLLYEVWSEPSDNYAYYIASIFLDSESSREKK